MGLLADPYQALRVLPTPGGRGSLCQPAAAATAPAGRTSSRQAAGSGIQHRGKHHAQWGREQAEMEKGCGFCQSPSPPVPTLALVPTESLPRHAESPAGNRGLAPWDISTGSVHPGGRRTPSCTFLGSWRAMPCPTPASCLQDKPLILASSARSSVELAQSGPLLVAPGHVSGVPCDQLA